jgi:hypothetical protein
MVTPDEPNRGIVVSDALPHKIIATILLCPALSFSCRVCLILKCVIEKSAEVLSKMLFVSFMVLFVINTFLKFGATAMSGKSPGLLRLPYVTSTGWVQPFS